MRCAILFAAIFALLAYGAGCGTVSRNIVEKPTAQSETRVYEVFGMNCPGCHGAVEKLVEKIPAVEQSEANWEQKRLAVRVRPGSELSDEEVFDAMRRANFTPGKRIK